MTPKDWNLRGWLISLLWWGTGGSVVGSVVRPGWGFFVGFFVGCIALIAAYPLLPDVAEDHDSSAWFD